jgi:probable phosphoglycerate mutase
VLAAPGLVEVDYGAWTGRDFATFGDDAAWRAWNAARGVAGVPGGETFAAVQGRAMTTALSLAALHGDDARVVAVSHADVVRAVVGHVLGIAPELQGRLEIEPASVSEVEFVPWGARVIRVNDRVTPAG